MNEKLALLVSTCADAHNVLGSNLTFPFFFLFFFYLNFFQHLIIT